MKIKPGAFWVSSCVVLLSVIGAHGVVDDKLEVLRLQRHISESRNVKAIQDMLEERDREEQKDPLNYLGLLYKEIEENSRRQLRGNQGGLEAFVDPPLVDLTFHKKIPNCGGEFNISRIFDLVEEDKKNRKACPACNNGKGKQSLLGWVQADKTPFNPEVSPALQMKNANLQEKNNVQQKETKNLVVLQQQSQSNNPQQPPNQGQGQSQTQTQNTQYEKDKYYPYKVNNPPKSPSDSGSNVNTESSSNANTQKLSSSNPSGGITNLQKSQDSLKSASFQAGNRIPVTGLANKSAASASKSTQSSTQGKGRSSNEASVASAASNKKAQTGNVQLSTDKEKTSSKSTSP